MKRVSSIVILVFLAAMVVTGQVPPSVGELSYRLTSPVFLGGGGHMIRTQTPQSIALNPAAAAGYQRTIVDANYILLYKLDDGGGTGHSVNLGLAIPTRVGVVTGTLGFLDTFQYRDSAMDLGRYGNMNLAFSKEIYSDVWFGLGLSGQVGELDGDLQGGGALSVGFLHFPETFRGLKNFRWGGSLNGLGYQYGSSSRGYFNAIPNNITPAMGIAFDIVETEEFRWSLLSDVRAPSVNDLWAGIATDLIFGDSFRLTASSSLDMRDAFAGGWETIIPSATLAVHFSLGGAQTTEEKRIQTTEMDIQIAAAPLYDGVWGFSGGLTLPLGVRDENPPLIDVTYDPSLQYISPNYDGIQDELLVPYEATDERFITAYKWWITDENGKVVRTYFNKDERPENETVKNLWLRLISPKEGTPLPEQFRWDGVTDTGSMAPDGEYQVYMEFRDDNDNVSQVGPFPVVVDTLVPEFALAVPEGLDLIFSPDGDNLKDTFAIVQSGSVEHLWNGVFEDSSEQEVRGWTWKDAQPKPQKWDGTDESGEVVPDGVYRYVLSATDLAGNASEGRVQGIIIDTRQPEVGLTIDRSIFSPGTVSPISMVTMEPIVPVKSGIVDWKLEILDSTRQTVRVWSHGETSTLPLQVDFDGRDTNGRRLAEGAYTGRLTIEYSNGFRPVVSSPPFIVDVTPPSATLSVDYRLFSPQSGSRRNQVTFSQSTSPEGIWMGTLRSPDNTVVKSWEWIENADATLVWDGRDAQGRLVPDGTYAYTLESIDSAGNPGASSPVRVTVDTSAVEASLTASLDVFGPTGNGINDAVDFFMTARTDSPVGTWRLIVEDAGGAEIRRWEGGGAPPDRAVWNGRKADGQVAPDGEYRASLVVEYEKGDVATAQTGTVVLDTAPPIIEVEIADGLFSPDGDGLKDILAVVQQSSQENFFGGYIADVQGRPLRNWVWKNSLGSFEWDGTDDSGNPLPDGIYRYEAFGIDRAGNETRQTVGNIRIDTAPTPVYLTANRGYLKAGETDPKRFQTFTAVVPNTEGIVSWSFAVENEKGISISGDSGSGGIPSQFTWNGTDRSGRSIEGSFRGVLTVEYKKGARPRGESRTFISDGSPPNTAVVPEPQPFSPDGDNVDDEVVIGLTVEDRSRISEWSLKIYDPREREFITFSGRGQPSERIIWDGRSGRGDLVESAEDYPYLLTVTDVLGNTARNKGSIAIDVLVIREGDRLKILINNITFQPSSSQLILLGEEGEKNREVLDRLAEIMTKYGSYRIVVEGHAVSLNWANPAASAREQQDILVPLSEARAQTVVDELIIRGIAAKRLTAQGIGGEKPIVPHGDLEERWRNRRVEFYLEK